jgi:hypothetical protein
MRRVDAGTGHREDSTSDVSNDVGVSDRARYVSRLARRCQLTDRCILSLIFPCANIGSATQVMLTIQVRATVGQKHHPPEGGQRQPWVSGTCAQGVDRYSSRRTAIFIAASRITGAKPVDASLWPAPKAASLLTSSARWLRTCSVSAFPCAGSVGRGGVSLTWLFHLMVERFAACPDHLHAQLPVRPTAMVIRRLEAEADEMWSFVGKKANKP